MKFIPNANDRIAFLQRNGILRLYRNGHTNMYENSYLKH